MRKGLLMFLVCVMLITLVPMSALATEESSAAIDLTALQIAITAANQRVEEIYTVESWAPFAATLSAAQAMLANINATQEEVNAAAAVLQAATAALVIAPVQRIALSTAERHTFPAAMVGYTAQVPHSVTVTNTGNLETGTLAVALTGEDADAFTISTEIIPSIAVGEAANLTVRPNNGLAVGAYTATVTVYGEKVEEQSFTVYFTVGPNRAMLQEMLDAALEREQSNYTLETWVRLLFAKSVAQSVLDNENATQTQIANAAATLERAKDGLVPLDPGNGGPDPPDPDREALKAALEAAGQREQDNYTPESWIQFLFAKVVAEDVMENAEATETQIADAIAALQAAKKDLVRILPFTDVPEDHWARLNGSIAFMWSRGFMTGISDTLFAPNFVLTRAQVVRILWNIEDQPEVAFRPVFDDVRDTEATAWYSVAVLWAYEHDIVRGVGEGRFAPHEIVTRQEIATMLLRFAQWKEVDTTTPEDFDFTDFPDYDQVSLWAETGMRWTVYNEFIRGTDLGMLNPHGTASRAECATILQRFLIAFGE